MGEAQAGEARGDVGVIALCVTGLFRELDGDPGAGGDRTEENFELRVGEAEGVLVEDGAQRLDPGLAGSGVERVAQLFPVSSAPSAGGR